MGVKELGAHVWFQVEPAKPPLIFLMASGVPHEKRLRFDLTPISE